MTAVDGYDRGFEAGLTAGRYTTKQKEWLARYLATSLASGPADKVHNVNIDDWIKEVKNAFDLIEKNVATER